jgi:hypothetical protein
MLVSRRAFLKPILDAKGRNAASATYFFVIGMTVGTTDCRTHIFRIPRQFAFITFQGTS